MTAQASQARILQLTEEEHAGIGQSLFQTALRRLRHDPLTMSALAVLTMLALLSILAPVICDQTLGVSYSRTNLNETFLPIGSPGHILGTDDLGRDYLARLLYGGQVSLGIAFSAALLSLGIGVSLGVITGFYGGIVDDFVTWVITTLSSIPSLLLLLIIVAVFQPSPTVFVLVLGLLGWTGTTRLVRGETFSIREREYILRARAIGASPWRIMFVHILPNLFSIVIVSLALDIGALILTEAGLSFLGFGVKPPTPSWGNLLTGAQNLYTMGPHLIIIPGLLITITVLCLYVIGDGIRDAFDPRLVEKN